MVKLLQFAAVLMFVGALAGCSGSRGGPIPYEVQNFGPPDTPKTVTLEEDYRIAPADTLKITVFSVDKLSGDYEVDLTGNIAFPLLGNVKAADLTTAQLDDVLTQRLERDYLNRPDVAVAVKESTRSSVTVDGSVRSPGMYPLNGPTTLLQAIALAKGADETANPHRVAVFRQIQGQRMAAAFDLTSIRRGEAEDPAIYRGDIIVVDGSKAKALQKEIMQSIPLLSIFRPF